MGVNEMPIDIRKRITEHYEKEWESGIHVFICIFRVIGLVIKIKLKEILKFPEDAGSWDAKGFVLYELGAYKTAIKAFERTLEINPKYADAWNGKGIALDMLGEHKEAIKAYDKALEINPEDIDAWNNKGVTLGKLRKHEEAIKAYDKALEINLEYTCTWYNKGVALGELGENEEAIKAYDKALEINPKYAGAWNNKGAALGELGKDEEAIKAYDEALEIDPKNADARNNKGIALGKLGENEAAIKAFDKALKINPKHTDAWNNKGVALGELGENEAAIKAYDKALKINPKNAGAWNNKGVALGELGKYEDAIKAYGIVLEINSENTQAHNNLGELFFNLGNLEDASKKVEDLLTVKDALLAVDKNRADDAYGLALSLQARIKIEGLDYNSAGKSFKEAISLGMGKPLLLLWDAYANYLNAEFITNSKGVRYHEKIVSIIRKLERAKKISEKQGEKETQAYILYFLGYFYYKSNDIITAKETLEECVRKSRDSIKSTASDLLNNIWNYQIRPNWMYWWLASPLHCWRKRFVFCILLLSIFASFFLHPFISMWFPSLQINLTLFIFFIAFLIFILISPGIERFKAKEFEVEMHTTPPVEFVLSPATMGVKIKELEKHR